MLMVMLNDSRDYVGVVKVKVEQEAKMKSSSLI